jgi:uncharacterized protein (TIRG00374 family)
MRRAYTFGIVAASTAIILAVILYGDVGDITANLRLMSLDRILIILALSFSNFIFRFLRWHIYTRTVGLALVPSDSITVFVSGLAMVMTPARFGEIAKAFILRQINGSPLSTTVPIIVVERLMDLAAVALLSTLGLRLVSSGQSLIFIPATFILISLVVLGSKRGAAFTYRLAPRKLRITGSEALRVFRSLLHPSTLAVSIVLSVLAWASQGAGLWWTVTIWSSSFNLMEGIAIYAIATLAGALSLLPGGLLGTEITMVALLESSGVDRAVASSSTVVIRVFTLWFAVALGLAALWRLRTKL